jgi:hypothetical protein
MLTPYALGFLLSEGSEFTVQGSKVASDLNLAILIKVRDFSDSPVE